MKKLEDQEEQIDVETAYKSSQEEKKTEDEDLPAKFLMQSVKEQQEPVQTET